jgi:molybdopterin/thiamine biosynthesis adenylyltransferase
LLARYFGGTTLMRRPIERADAAWIHGRGQDPRAEHLRSMSVVVIGCGSMGGPVAVALAQAGVGRIILIDFDTLTWANVGRHPLGAGYVNRNKAKGLAEKLRADFPHTTIEHYDTDVDTAVRQHAELLASADLIVAATGSWAADGRLDAWQAATGRAVPIVYGWMEPHACAGHALLLAGDDACLRYGFDGTGLPDFRVTDWPAGTPTRQEPACGAVFQPYGPVELGYVNGLVSELALDTLLSEENAPPYRVWVGSGKRLRQLGGAWTPDWQADPQFRDAGGFIAERAWPQARCLHCTKVQAA